MRTIGRWGTMRYTLLPIRDTGDYIRSRRRAKMSWQPEIDELERGWRWRVGWAARGGRAAARAGKADGARAHRPPRRSGVVPRVLGLAGRAVYDGKRQTSRPSRSSRDSAGSTGARWSSRPATSRCAADRRARPADSAARRQPARARVAAAVHPAARRGGRQRARLRGDRPHLHARRQRSVGARRASPARRARGVGGPGGSGGAARGQRVPAH